MSRFAPPQGYGTATSADILGPATATYRDAQGPRTGTMPNNGSPSIVPSGTAPVALTAGYYAGGQVDQVDVPAADVLAGTTIAGVGGAMPNNGSPTLQPGAALTAGYYSGGSAAAVKVATGSGSTVSGNNFNLTNGSTFSFYTCTVPVPSGLGAVLMVVVALGVNQTQTMICSPFGYCDGGDERCLAFCVPYGATAQALIAAGSPLQMDAAGIVVPLYEGTATPTFAYTLYYT